MARRALKVVASATLLAVTLAILFTLWSGRPFVSYASSGSMEPTIGTLDGFLVNPWPASVQPGDIIVFRSTTHDGPAVHRVVALDGDGWITQGDANMRADQDQGEPTVTRANLLGKVVTGPDGAPFLVKDLGVSLLDARQKLVMSQEAVGGPQAFFALMFLSFAALSALPALFARKKRQLPPRRSLGFRPWMRRILPRGLLGRHVGASMLLLLLGSTALAATQAHHGVTTTMVVLQDPSSADDVRAQGPGGELRREIEVGSMPLVRTVVVLDPDTNAIRTPEESVTVGSRETRVVEVWQRAGDKVGLQNDVVQVWRYPAVLPESTIMAMHRAMPGLPYVVLGGIIGAIGAIWYFALRIGTLPVARTVGIQEDWL